MREEAVTQSGRVGLNVQLGKRRVNSFFVHVQGQVVDSAPVCIATAPCVVSELDDAVSDLD